MTKSTWSITALAFACILAMTATGRAAASDGNSSLLGQLRSGGYVIYLRHSMTDTSRSDADPIDINDCATQRPLSDAGRVLARKIGEAFRNAQIPAGHVVSSPLCRAVETAALESPELTRTTSGALWYSLAVPKDEADRAAAMVRRMLGTPPDDGTNMVIVGHSSNLKEASGVWPKKEGGAMVFRPDGHGDFALIGLIDPTDFERAAK